MARFVVFQPIIQAISLAILAVWWIFYIAWKPGFVTLVQLAAFRVEPPLVGTDVVHAATSRAMEYATKGTAVQSDIFFTQAEVSHLLDVSKIFKRMRVSLAVLAVVACASLLYSLYKQTFYARSFRVASNLLFFLTIGSLLALFVFPFFFLLFHELLFPQGNWAFPADSMLIQLFPETFWKLSLGWFFMGVGMFAVFYRFVSGHRNHDG